MFIYDLLIDNFSTAELYGLATLTIIWFIQFIFYASLFSKPTRYAIKEKRGKIWFSAAKPNVSVILYCNEYFDNFDKHLKSFLNQDYPNFEVVVVNDGSNNELKDTITLLKEEYPHLSYTYVPEEAHSLSRKKLALTVGVKAAKYDIIGFSEAFCSPVSSKWLSQMVRNFTPDIDIVIGNTFESGQEQPKWSLKFYRLYFKLKYFSYAIMQRPYMGEGTNMFINKSLFFENRGFSSNLSMQYGEDDIFANEIMTPHNTRVELSCEAAMENILPDINGDLQEMRLRRTFTNKILKTSSHFIFGVEQVTAIVFYIGVILLIIWGVATNYLLSLSAISMFLLRYITQSVVIKRASETLNAKLKGYDAILYDFIRPIDKIRYLIKSKNSIERNYTWRIRR